MKSRAGVSIDIRNRIEEALFLEKYDTKTLHDISAFVSLFKSNSVALPLQFHGRINQDGCYPTFANLDLKDRYVLSIGVGNNQLLDIQLSRLGAKVFMFDHTVGPSSKLLRKHKNIQYFPIGIGPKRKPPLDTLEGLIEKIPLKNSDRLILLKIDVEGDEYKSLCNIPQKTLAKIDQIAIEIHHLNRFTDPKFATNSLRLFEKLLKQFAVIYISPNNYGGAITLESGLFWPFTVEVLMVNKSLLENCEYGRDFAKVLQFRNRNWRLGKDMELSSWL